MNWLVTHLFQSHHDNAKFIASKKPLQTSKSKEYQLSSERHVDLWKNVESEELLLGGENIQKLLKSVQKPLAISEISRKFKNSSCRKATSTQH